MKRLKRVEIETTQILDGAGLQITRTDGRAFARGVLVGVADSAGVLKIAWYEPEGQEFGPADPRITRPTRYQIVGRDGDELIRAEFEASF